MGIAASVKAAGFAGVAAVERMAKGGGTADLRGMTNFLVLQHSSALGNVVHTTPLMPALREAVPGCRIIVAASGMSREVCRVDPDVERVIETANPTKDWKTAARDLRGAAPFGREPFCTLTPTGNERTTVVLQSMMSGGWRRVGFTVVPRMFVTALKYDHGLSQIANNLRIVTALGHTVRHHEPRICFGEEELAFARALLRESGAAEGQPVAIFVTQTSVTQRKSWRAERFQAAARFLRERFGALVVFVGTAAESAAIDAIRAGLEFPTANLAGRTNLLQLAALLSLGDVGLTLDTGTLHIGRAVGLPMVIVAPAWSPPLEWLPLNDPRYVILKNLDMVGAPDGYIIDEVSVEEVTEALAALLKRYPVGTRAVPSR